MWRKLVPDPFLKIETLAVSYSLLLLYVEVKDYQNIETQLLRTFYLIYTENQRGFRENRKRYYYATRKSVRIRG